MKLTKLASLLLFLVSSAASATPVLGKIKELTMSGDGGFVLRLLNSSGGSAVLCGGDKLDGWANSSDTVTPPQTAETAVKGWYSTALAAYLAGRAIIVDSASAPWGCKITSIKVQE